MHVIHFMCIVILISLAACACQPRLIGSTCLWRRFCNTIITPPYCAFPSSYTIICPVSGTKIHIQYGTMAMFFICINLLTSKTHTYEAVYATLTFKSTSFQILRHIKIGLNNNIRLSLSKLWPCISYFV